LLTRSSHTTRHIRGLRQIWGFVTSGGFAVLDAFVAYDVFVTSGTFAVLDAFVTSGAFVAYDVFVTSGTFAVLDAFVTSGAFVAYDVFVRSGGFAVLDLFVTYGAFVTSGALYASMTIHVNAAITSGLLMKSCFRPSSRGPTPTTSDGQANGTQRPTNSDAAGWQQTQRQPGMRVVESKMKCVAPIQPTNLKTCSLEFG